MRIGRGDDEPGQGPWLVVGLGNPGPQYAHTRHNAGHFVVDLLTERVGGKAKSHRTQNDLVEGHLSGQRVVLAKPRTYMNTSGGPVASLAKFYKGTPERLIVVHDELDIPFGALRLKRGGGDNGHNGLRSVTQSLGDKNYLRVRFGIGRPPGRMDPAAFVLKDFGTAERKEIPYLVDRAADAIESLIAHGLETTQNTYHAD